MASAKKVCRTCKFYLGNAVSGKCLVTHGPTRATDVSTEYQPVKLRSRTDRMEDFEDYLVRRKKKKKKKASKKAPKRATKKKTG